VDGYVAIGSCIYLHVTSLREMKIFVLPVPRCLWNELMNELEELFCILIHFGLPQYFLVGSNDSVYNGDTKLG
jgi:hypothetical protein